MRGHYSFLIIIIPKDNTQAFKMEENKHSKSNKNGYEGNLSALYLIIEVIPSLLGFFNLHPIPHDL